LVEAIVSAQYGTNSLYPVIEYPAVGVLRVLRNGRVITYAAENKMILRDRRTFRIISNLPSGGE
jgi:hypothetical protein